MVSLYLRVGLYCQLSCILETVALWLDLRGLRNREVDMLVIRYRSRKPVSLSLRSGMDTRSIPLDITGVKTRWSALSLKGGRGRGAVSLTNS